ncbi:cadherin-like beta sandwich domain-containing protein [Gordoniibacillus kamchatkensis]|uniref:cadherin-like beta sandwich domain-containing protein n=1 Tax=Gordoniibacillus kamchatkensis TaxID=1590651 RepID=UPI000AA2490E|nr:cadherin-like beta sandwich domain-containing protein [Paenibacillus sp. VKM B-2647]
MRDWVSRGLRLFIAGILFIGGAAGTPLFEKRAQAAEYSWGSDTAITASDLTGVEYNGKFVAVDKAGEVLNSSDGKTWTKVTTISNARLNGVVFSFQAAAFVAVGTDTVTGAAVAFTSWDNGATWNRHNVGVNAELKSVSSAQMDNTIVAVGDNGTIVVSSDGGTSWHTPASVPSGSAPSFTGTAFSPNGMFIAVGSGGACWYSTDSGENWQALSLGTSENLNGVVQLGVFYVLGDNNTVYMVWPDSKSIYKVTGFPDSVAGRKFTSIASDYPNSYVIVGNNGTVLTSPNGSSNWTDESVAGGPDFNAIIESNGGLYTAVGTNGAIYHRLSSNANLSALTVGQASLSPSFSAAVTGYSANVSNEVNSIGIKAALADGKAQGLTIGGQTAANNAAMNVSLSVGPNPIDIVVKAQDGTTKTYTVTVNRDISKNLSHLTIDSGKLQPDFAPGQPYYTATVAQSVNQLAITPTLEDSAAAIKLGGNPVANGQTVSVPLSSGDNTIILQIFGQIPGVHQDYTLQVYRTSAPYDIMLSRTSVREDAAIGTTVGSLTAADADAGDTFTFSLADGTGADDNSSFAISGGQLVTNATFRASAKSLYRIRVQVTDSAGNIYEKPFQIQIEDVTAPVITGVTDQASYTSAVAPDSPDSDIASVELSRDGAPVAGYALGTPISATGRYVLKVSDTSGNASSVQFSVLSANTALADVQLDGTALSESPETAGLYTAFVSTDEETAMAAVSPADAGATVTVNGQAASGGQAVPIRLRYGTNEIPIIVTAQDGVHIRSYTLKITRKLSSVARLSSLEISGATLEPAFNENVTSYQATAPFDASAVSVTAAVYDLRAALTINGQGAVSGQAIPPIALGAEDRTIQIVVTAQDGSTQPYTVIVHREDAPGPTQEELDAQAVTWDLAGLSIGYVPGDSESGVTGNLKLPATGANGTVISWSSSKPAVVSNSGAVIRPSYSSGNADVTLTAEVAKNGARGSKTFRLVIKAEPMRPTVPSDPGDTGSDGPGAGAAVPESPAPGGSAVTPPPHTDAGPAPDLSQKRDEGAAAAGSYFMSKVVDAAAVVSYFQSKAATAKQSPAIQPFPDTQQHWAERAIRTFAELDIAHGYGDGTFKPDNQITRAEFAFLLTRAFDIQAGGSQADASFSDLNGHWAQAVIVTLADAGITGGYGDGSFRPDKPISREEMVVMLSRVLNLQALPKDGDKGSFTDLGDSYASEQIRAAAQAGIINGMADGSFVPKQNATRAEALTVLLNALNRIPQIKAVLDTFQS